VAHTAEADTCRDILLVLGSHDSIHRIIDLEKKRIVTEQATLPIGGTPELRWGNLKGMSAWMRE